MVTSYLDQNDIQFVDKHFNPQNCLQPKLYGQEWKVRNIDQLKRRIIDMNVVPTMFADI